MDLSRRRASLLLASPALLAVALAAAAPIGVLFRVALFPPGPLAPLAGGPEAGSFAALLDPPFPEAAMQTARLALLTTVLTALLAFPAAVFLSRSRGLFRRAQRLLVMTALLMSPVVHAYGWMLILGPEGFPGATLRRAGMLSPEAASLVTLTASFLPFMILALTASLDRVDPTLAEASRGLGAPPASTFFRVTFPLVLPGLLAGAGFVMVGSLSAYAVPALLGDPASPAFVVEIYERTAVSLDWPTAAAASLALLLSAMLLLTAAALLSRRDGARTAAGGTAA